MFDDNKNLLIAIALSLVVLIGWNYFIGMPQLERQRVAQQAPKPPAGQGGEASSAPPQPSAPASGTGAAPVEPREVALAKSPRVKIDTPAIAGSIALRG